MQVPDAWWKEACHVIKHPMACVGRDNRFIWVNPAFERLVGYSLTELRELTWMEITVQADVGGDLLSAQSLIDGKDTQYTMAKHYRHKFGDEIPVELTVWRFPAGTGEILACFIVEAIPRVASKIELEELKSQLEQGISNLEVRWRLLEEQHRGERVQVNYHSQNAAERSNVSREDTITTTTNSSTLLLSVIALVAVMFISIVVLIVSGKLDVQSRFGDLGVESGNNTEQVDENQNEEAAP